jgi:hypothetical protein
MADTVETTAPDLTPEEKAKAETARRREITKKLNEEAEQRLHGLTHEQRDHLAKILLKGTWSYTGQAEISRRRKVMELVFETWVKDLNDADIAAPIRRRRHADYVRRMEWVLGYFGTSFKREGEERYRNAKISKVVAELVKFCLSAGDRVKGKPSDLGMFAETADPKTGQALLDLSNEGVAVAITEEGYNQTQKLLRLLEEEFGDKVFEGKEMKGTKVADYVAEVKGKLTQLGVTAPTLPDRKAVRTLAENERTEEGKKRKTAYQQEKHKIEIREMDRQTEGLSHK